MTENQELKLVFDFVKYTNRNIFLTGKAGTGKTTFLHSIREAIPKRMVVTAPTGVAAINAGGVTIHSFFQLPFGPLLPGRQEEAGAGNAESSMVHKFSKKKIGIIRSIDLLVIDEVSMVRADLLDGIDRVLKRFRNRNLPFGGVQLLMIGDLQQLPPVVKQDEEQMLRQHYHTLFFFGSHAFQKSNPVTIELKHIYRQQDDRFIRILNEVRNDLLTTASIEELNRRFIPGFRPDPGEGYIILTTHNAAANRINDEELGKLPSKAYTFEAGVEGTFPEYAYPADPELVIKKGARVMFIRNDPSYAKRYFNGKTGTVTSVEDDLIAVQCDGEADPIVVEQIRWKNIRYTLDDRTKQIEEEVLGTFYQYPLRLAWAITIHKSQGLTFDRAVIDAGAAFAHGQIYVALSRCRTLEGLVLSSRISGQGIIQDNTVLSFNREMENNIPDEKALNDSKRAFVMALLEELFSYRQVVYQLDKCGSIATENKGSLPDSLPGALKAMNADAARVLDELGSKFLVQLKHIAQQDAHFESGNLFRERIGKAGAYFLERTKLELLLPLQNLYFESDNRAVGKAMEERVVKLRELLHVKKACLLTLKDGFDFTRFLNARAIASVQDYSGKGAVVKVPEKTTSDHPDLLSRLRDWRNAMAADLGLTLYRVAAQKVLVAISNALPADRTQLKAVKGMGPAKLNQFGNDILAIVEKYRRDKNLPFPEPPLTGIERTKPVKKHTWHITIELYRQGKTISEIAIERNLKEQTIEGHLAHFVGTGELSPEQFVPREKAAMIMSFFMTRPDAMLSEAKESLGEEVTWSELRFVQSYMEYLQLER